MELLNTLTIEWQDILVIVGYFVCVILVGMLSSRKSKGNSVSGYFLASRNMHWLPIGASLYSSSVGSGHFIGLAGSGAATGIGIAAFELNASFALLLLGWLFVPVYLSSGVYTMPEYLRERFGGQRIRIYLSVLTLILCIFTQISADLYAGAIFIQESVGQKSQEWLYISILILLAIAAVFTIAGGLTAVMWTDFIQTIIMVAGAVVVMVVSFYKVGSYSETTENFFYAIPTNVSDQYADCAKPPSYSMNFFRPAAPGASDIPWTGLVFGTIISAIWYWCTNQVIVQRVLASKDVSHAKGGCVLAALLKMLPLWLMVMPGMCARILYPDEVACVEPEKCKQICGSEAGCTNTAFIKLVVRLLPTGLRGAMMAVMLAALMSSLTSVFNSSATIFTIDIWERIRRNSWKKMNSRTIEIEKLIVGRFFVLLLVVIAVIWIPVLQNYSNSQLFVYTETISAFLSPPICGVYLLGLLWKRTNEPGAFWGLMVGLIIGTIRFVLEFAYFVPPCGSLEEDPRPEIIKTLVGNIHFLHFGVILLFITCIVTISVSLLTEPIPDKCLYRLTYWSRNSTLPRMSVKEWKNEKIEEKFAIGQEMSEKKNPSNQTDKDAATVKKEESSSCRCFYAICGFGSSDPELNEFQEMDKTPEEAAKDSAAFIKERKTPARIANAAAILSLMLAFFIYGFYR